MFRNYLVVAWRNLRRNQVFSVINILGLALGLTCCALISLYIRHETSYDDYHPAGDRLYQVGMVEKVHGETFRFQGSPNVLAGMFQSGFPEVEQTARITPLLGDDKTLLQYFPAQGETRSFNEDKGFTADSGYFRLFHYDFTEGNSATAISAPNSIVLSKDIADKLFNGAPALHKIVHVNSHVDGEHDFEVTAVFKSSSKPSHIDGRFFLSMYAGDIGDMIRHHTNMASNYFFVTYLRLKEGSDPGVLEKKFPAFVTKYEEKDLKVFGTQRSHFLTRVSDIHLHANMTNGDVTPGGSVTYLYILGSIALFTLLIACINFMNLATARSGRRAAEVGVRKTIGASRSALIGQFLGESLLMSLFAVTIATAAIIFLLPGFNHLSGKVIVLGQRDILKMAGGLLLLGIVTGLIAGSYPALYLSSFKPVQVLKGKITHSLGVVSLRKALVIFQFSISIVLLVAMIIIARQMSFLRTNDLGFAKDNQVIIPLRSGNARKLYPPMKASLSKVPDVISTGASYFYPGFVAWNDNFYAEGKDSRDCHFAYVNYVDFDYLQSMGTRAVAGHLFSEKFSGDSVDGIVLNETSVHELGYTLQNAVGRKVFSTPHNGQSYTIVGVVNDFHVEDLHQSIRGASYLVNSNPVFNYIIVRVSPKNIQTTLDKIRQTWHTLNPDEPFEYSFLDEQFQQHYEADERLADIVKYATGMAVFISCLGLFGLAAFSAEQRTKEIGIRKVLGAGVPGLLLLLSRDFIKLVGIAILIGCPIGWYVTHKWLQDFAFRTPVTWPIFALSIAAALGIALVTISFQAVRAALANPVKSLRSE